MRKKCLLLPFACLAVGLFACSGEQASSESAGDDSSSSETSSSVIESSSSSSSSSTSQAATYAESDLYNSAATEYSPDTFAAILSSFGNTSTTQYTGGYTYLTGTVSSATYNSSHSSYTVILTTTNGSVVKIYSGVIDSSISWTAGDVDSLAGKVVHAYGYAVDYVYASSGDHEYEIAYSSTTKFSPVITEIEGASSGETGGDLTELPEPTDITIAELLKKTATDNTALYRVSGILEDYAFDTKGNGYLTDPTTGDSIMIYGSSLEEDSGLSIENGYIAYTNPDAGAKVAGFADNGDYVTMVAQYVYYVGYSYSTPELMGYFATSVDSTYTYGVEVDINDETAGSVSLSKSSGLAYGESVTVTPTASGDKVLLTIELENAYGDGEITNNGDGTYSFLATCVNKLTVSFGAVNEEALVLTVDSINAPSSYGDVTSYVDGIKIIGEHIYNGGNGIQMRINNGTASAIYNSDALKKPIASITLNYNSKQSATKDLLYIAFGDSVLSSTSTGTIQAYDGTTSVTITPSVNTYTYFKIGHTTTSGAVYLDSISVNYVTE